VKALLRAPNAKKQYSPSHLRRKLREGDVLELVAESTHEEED